MSESFDGENRRREDRPENSAGRQQPGVALPPARVVTNTAAGHDYLVIPIEKPTESGGVLPFSAEQLSGPSDVDIVELVLAEQQARHSAETERDALADRVAQDFEELHWLRALATVVSTCDATTDLRTVAQAILPELRELVRAEAVALLPDQNAPRESARPNAAEGERGGIVWSGKPAVDHRECRKLARQIQRRGQDGPIVYNRSASVRSTKVSTRARNILAVPLKNGGRRYGWLMAFNRVVSGDAATGDAASGLNPPEFGSHEVGIMTTAAGMLAGQARNVELFQSEQELRLDIIETVTEAVDARDPYTCGHSRRVAEMATRIAAQLGFSSEKQHALYITGLMHDVGKIGIPDNILQKNGRLTDEEFDVIKQHPSIGHTILSPLRRLSFVLPGVLHHHERIDGWGYPHGLRGDEIPLDARILAVADSYDAMTSDRAYRPGMPASKAVSILKDGAGTQWDCSVVAAFLTANGLT